MFSKISGATAVALLAAVAKAQENYGGIPQYTAPSHSEASTTPVATSNAPSSTPVQSTPEATSEPASSSVESSAAVSSSVDVASSAATSAASETPASITSSASLPLSTASNGDVYVTSTVYKTSEITILSCKPEVTDCPANHAAQTHTITTTATVPDYVTVCPVTASLGVPSPSSVAPFTTLGLTSAPLTTFISSSAVTTPEATSKPFSSSSEAVVLSTETLVPVVPQSSSAPGYGAPAPSSAASASSVATTPEATIKASSIALSSEIHSTAEASSEASSATAPGYGAPAPSSGATTTPEATTKPFSTSATTAPFSAGNVTSAFPTGSAPVGTGKTVIPTTDASVPGYGHESPSSHAESTPVATSKPILSTGTGAHHSHAIPTGHGPFSMSNNTEATHGPTGTGTGTGAAPITTKPVTQAQTVTFNVDSTNVITKTIDMTSYETVFGTEFVTDSVPATTAAVGTTEFTTPVAVTYTISGEEKTSTMDITQTHTIFSTLHLISVAHVTQTIPGASSPSAPAYGGSENSAVSQNNNVATNEALSPSAPAATSASSGTPETPVGGQGGACDCGDKETVTVTLPKETVYVTMGAMGSATASVVTAPLATSTGSPYSMPQNGTHNQPTSGFLRPTGASSGFLTSTKPAKVSEYSSTAAAKTTAAAVSSAAKSTPTPIGYGKRFFGLL